MSILLMVTNHEFKRKLGIAGQYAIVLKVGLYNVGEGTPADLDV